MTFDRNRRGLTFFRVTAVAICVAASTVGHSQSLQSSASTPGGVQFQTTNAAAVYYYNDIYNGAIASAYAQTDYGFNHASAQIILPSPESYFLARGTSTYTDSFNFFVLDNLVTGWQAAAAQYKVVLDGTMTLPLGFDSNTGITIQSAHGTGGVVDSSTTDAGAYLFENSSYTQWELSTGVNGASYTSQSYALVGGTDTITVGLTAGVQGDTTSYAGTGIVDFSNTAILTDIVVYNQFGNPIPTDDLLVTSASGAHYAFSPSTPEPSSLVVFSALGVAAGATIKRRRRKAQQSA